MKNKGKSYGKQKENRKRPELNKVYLASPDSLTTPVTPAPLALPVLGHLRVTGGARAGSLGVAVCGEGKHYSSLSLFRKTPSTSP